MVSPTEEKIIWRAARSQRRYWLLVAGFTDDQRRKLALITRYVEVERELRGERRESVVAPIDCWIPLREAVDLEIARRRPGITIEVALERSRRRLAVSCGYVELELSFRARARRKLRAIIWASGLSIREVAGAFGVATTTVERHLAGHKPNRERLAFYQRLESVTVDGGYVIVAIKCEPATRKKYGWRKPLPDDDVDEAAD